MHPWSRLLAARCRLDSAEIVGRRLAGLTIGNDLEFDLLSFVEVLHAGAFDRADMHEDVLAAIGLLLCIRPDWGRERGNHER